MSSVSAMLCCVTDAGGQRRLAFSLTAALVLHGLLLSWIGGGRLVSAPGRLTVELRRLPEPAVGGPEAVSPGSERAGSRASRMERASPAAPAEEWSAGVREIGSQVSDSEASDPPETAEALAASARDAARRFAHEGGSHGDRGWGKRPASPEIADRPILPALDRTLAREAPGEKPLANGLTRVVTAAGTVYCLQTMPDFMQGPGGVRSLVVTCP